MADPEDFSQLPLQEQFVHKNWKARKGGYETAAKEFKTAQPGAPIVKDFTYDSSLWKGAVADSNVAAQQEALSAYNAFLDIAGAEGAKRTRSGTVQPIVEKGLTGRPAAKAAALESLLLLVELDKADPIVEELIPLVSAKVPKVIVAAISALKEIYHAYGCKVVEPKPVLKILAKAYGHADKNVRAEAQALTVELYRWLREAMKPLFWGELKELQQKDLEKLFEPIKAESPPKQERLLRSQQAAREIAQAAGEDGEEGDGDLEEDAVIDLEPEFEAVDVVSKLPKDFQERLGSSKWKDRKEVLDEVFAIVNVPAIQEGHFDELVRGCAKSMKDANIQVVTVAANITECLAKGLRRSFGKYKSTVLGPILERFKEKKASVTDALGTACDAIFASTSLGDVQTEVEEALKNKNPQIKEHTARFLVRSLKTTKVAPTPEQTKEVAEASKKLLSESVASIRDAGSEILGTLWKIMGDRNMLSHLDGVEEIRKTKIKEFHDAAEVKAKWKPKAAPAPKTPAGGPAARKPGAPGTKRPAAGATKKPAAPVARKLATPEPMEEESLQSRPSSRPAPSARPGGLRPPGGLKAPSGITKPGGLKVPSSSASSGTASPKRQGMVLDDAPALLAPKTPGPGRGLAGRSLGKPPATPASPPLTQKQEPVQSALSQIERQELSDLRQEVEVMRQQAGDLRNDKMKLTSTIAELQNQNAQLIEDHTRDVLQVKAKETQLVRARSDAAAAEEHANTLSYEIDRMKREMSRLTRAQQAQSIHAANSGRDSPVGYTNGASEGFSSVRSPYSSRGLNREFGSEYSHGDKENVPDDRSTSAAKISNHNSRPMSGASSGRATPSDREPSDTPHTTYSNGVGRSDSLSRGSQSAEQGVESWRRAAEVTQNLKARIEMMKARQNIGRGQ
ncbi:hypothetical protein K431DRAFT_277856 [Polychaeton citri CBS 116435]|uniref:TOG domain-containing protein n=1 Tax=Polychaeton citri CBS 116435 TaxID=1314669 RepID=A0A9P4Q086_9PEZI|nr:hypothetical protein K431DRAFT_277856 [Polychaeton citri CBS 116435]